MKGFFKFPLIKSLHTMGDIECKLKKINAGLRSLNRITFVIILTSILCVIAFCFHFVLGFIKERDIILFDFSSKEKSIGFLFFVSIILAPVFETFFNQSLPYYLLNKVKYLNERSYLILLASALFFGLNHLYSVFYIIYAFLIGLVLMYGYMIRIKADNKTFYLIAICHSLTNLGIFTLNLF